VSSGEPIEQLILPRPFAADQIRDAWGAGFVLDLEFESAEGISRQRWTVVASDEDGAEIEYAVLDSSGKVVGEPTVKRREWIELRDHASFRTKHARRESVRRATPLGEWEGWLYTVEDPGAGTVTEFFFATELPGAPVEVLTHKDGRLVSVMRQIARHPQ